MDRVAFRKRVQWSALAILPMLTLGVSHTASAQDEEPAPGEAMVAFFENAEGLWNGPGIFKRLKNDGKYSHEDYKLRFHVKWRGLKQWQLETKASFSTWFSESRAVFAVRGDLLYAGQWSPTEPAIVDEATPDTLQYRFRRADQYGRIYDYVYRFKIVTPGEDPDLIFPEIRGFHTVELNDIIVTEDLFTITQ